MRLVHPKSASLDELVAAARTGDAPAFEELVRRTSADTFTLARRLVSDDDDARDVVQLYRYLSGSLSPSAGDQACHSSRHSPRRSCASPARPRSLWK